MDISEKIFAGQQRPLEKRLFIRNMSRFTPPENITLEGHDRFLSQSIKIAGEAEGVLQKVPFEKYPYGDGRVLCLALGL